MDAPGNMSGEQLVISGISGLYPNSKNVIEFMDNLYNKVDMVTTQFTEIDHPELPKHYGKISETDKFDAQFFRVPFKQATSFDAMARKLMEQNYCAMFDAGINPRELKGKKVGIYCGNSYQDYGSTSIYDYTSVINNDFVVSGSSKSMIANRISYWCDATGPSYTLDSADASFSEALEKAYTDMNNGICEAALVSGCSLCLLPNLCLNIKRTGTLCMDGKTKCFDKNGDGYVRSEAIGVIFLQKAKDAKRIYAEITYVKSNFCTNPENNFLAQRKPKEIESFLTEFYSEADVYPSEVEYVEGQGTGLAAADKNELQAIGDVFGKHKPVMVGCVKSNMGNSEPAAGLCAIVKLCLAYEKGILPANLHCADPMENSKVQILTDHAPFRGGYTAVNNFSACGANCHILMKGHYKPKILNRYRSDIPYLVCVSGRQESSIDKIVNILQSQPLDPEVIGLLHNIHKIDSPGHTCRGYVILDTDENGQTKSLTQSSELYRGGKRPLWFVYSGMGSQWASMGAALMRIPTFAAAIEKCYKVLEPKGIDLIRIITDPDKQMFDNILNCFVGITAVQIGLTDVLRAINIIPDNILGHSVGEIGCAYSDGGISAEDTILCSYTRGLVSIKSEFIKGSMAAVGLGFNELKTLCPPEIDIACHNSSESSTISGPADVITEFVKKLASKNIFVREVPCGNIAYHSRYVKKAAPAFRQGLREVIKTPAKRSEKWICSSLPKERWTEPLAQYSSAEYHANNFLSPVYFEEAARRIPHNAILVEVAPHGLLQAILKRSHPNCAHIPLTRRGNSDPVKYLLEALGKLYQEGFNPNIENLYPKIEYPVSTGTIPLSHFTEFHHERNWPIVLSGHRFKIMRPCREVSISVEDSDYQFITGHVREGNIVFPEAAILVTLWETLAMYNGEDYKYMSVSFRDVHFNGELILDPNQPLKVNFDITKGHGYFEVSCDTVIIANGYIYKSKPVAKAAKEEDKIDEINSEDIYSLLNTRGYYYTDEFRSIVSTNAQMNCARVAWNQNWITLLDSLIQLNILARNYNGTLVPKMIKCLDINTSYNIKTRRKNLEIDEPFFIAHVQPFFGMTRCNGIEIKEVTFENKLNRCKYPQVLQRGSFMPHITDDPLSIEDALLLYLQIVAENTQADVIKILNFTTGTKFNIASVIDKISDKIPSIDVNVMNTNNQAIKGSHLVVVPNIIGPNEVKLEGLLYNEFILSLNNSEEDLSKSKFLTVCKRKVSGTIMALLRMQVIEDDIKVVPIINGHEMAWISRVRSEIAQPGKVVLVSERKPQCGFRGLINILRNELGNKINFIGVDDLTSQNFNKETFYRNQLKKNLFVNILKDGQWGGYYYLPFPKTYTVSANFSLVIDNLGQLDSLNWAETSFEGKSGHLVKVNFAGISIWDVEKAVGLINTEDDRFGMDFSGIDEMGQKVMGLVSSGALASVVESDPQFVWLVPHQWTLEEAATVPLPYIHAYYCLFIRWQMRPGLNIFNIFVTGGADAFGQAVISICLSMGWNVFTSVEDIIKKHYLMKRFPELNENHICSSNETEFLNMITTQTKGDMCVLVINTYDGEMREYAMKCTGFSGIFMDVSNYDIRQNKPIRMNYLSKERTYAATNFSKIFAPEFTKDRKLLQKLFVDGITKGVVKPISHVVFGTDEIKRAFRLMSSDKRCGRFLIKMKEGSAAKHFNIIPRITCSSKDSFVIICDNSNLGIELANRLVKRGARNLILHLQQKDDMLRYLHTKYALWRQLDVKLDIKSDDLQIKTNHVKLLTKRNNDEQVHGVFYIKPQANGGIAEDDFVKFGNEVTTIASNLDSVSRYNCPYLKHFVIITRASNNLSDEYSTSVLANISQTRTESGQPALLFCTEIKNEDATGPHLIELQAIETALNSLESSLKQNFVDVLTHNISKTKPSKFLESVSQILGVNINSIDENLTAGDIISSIAIFEELRILLKDVTFLEYTVDAVKKITISRLKTINKVFLKKNTRFNSGLSTFYNFVNKKEIETSHILIPMPTIINKIIEKEHEMASNEEYLVLIPGFEGHPKVFESICERLKIRAVTCQLGPDMTNNSIADIAADIKKILKMRFVMKSQFQILGYSFGVNVALEVAALLEKEGFVGQVFCLDSSPDALRVQMDAYIGKLSADKLQNAIIEHMFCIISGQKDDILKKDLLDKTTWSEKVDLCIHKLRKYVRHSAGYQRAVLDSAYERMMLARNYYPNMRLESEIVLIKGIPHPKADTLPNDYNLSKYTKKPVRVFEISSDFASATEDCKVSNVINHLLHPESLKSIKTANLCDFYLSEPVSNM